MAEKRVVKKAHLDNRDTPLKNVWTPNSSGKRTDSHIYDLKKRKLYLLSEKTNLADIISNMVNESDDVICVSSFLIEDSSFTDSLLEAADRGVRIYLLTAKEDELEKDDTEFDDESKKKEIIRSHKNLLDKISGKILVRTSPDFHSKFVLFDPRSKNARGILTTSNLTKDAMSGRNLEMAVELIPGEIGTFFTQFIRGFWNEAKHEKIGREPVLKPVRDRVWDVDTKSMTHPCTCSSVRSLKEEVLRLIGSSKKDLFVSAWTFEKGHASTEAIKKASERGVKVRILSRDDPKSTGNIVHLSQSGAEVCSFERRVHTKFIVSDTEALIMTSNLSSMGLDSGFESGILLDQKESELFRKVVENLFENHSKRFRREARLGDLNETEHLRFDPLKTEHTKFTPKNKEIVDLGEKRVKIDEIEKYDPKGDLIKALAGRTVKEAEGTITLVAEVPEEKKEEDKKESVKGEKKESGSKKKR